VTLGLREQVSDPLASWRNGRNLIQDSEFTQTSRPVAAGGVLNNIGPYWSPTWDTVYDNTLGVNTIQCNSTDTSHGHGFIIGTAFTANPANPRPLIGQTNELWAFSAWFLGPPGLVISFGGRIQTDCRPNSGTVSEFGSLNFTCNGSWQRQTTTRVALSSWVGHYMNMQAHLLSNATALGYLFSLARPQIERGPVTPYAPTWATR
jgi:hypothetical protein